MTTRHPYYRPGPPDPDPDEAPPAQVACTYPVTVRCRHWAAPLHLRLPKVVRTLLMLLRDLQDLQDGNALQEPRQGEPDAEVEALEHLRPGDAEQCIIGAVALVVRCLWRGDDELMIVTRHEADALRAERQRTGTYPLSDRRSQAEALAPPDERQLALGGMLQGELNPGWVPMRERGLTSDEALP